MLLLIKDEMMSEKLGVLEQRVKSNARIAQIIRNQYIIADGRTFEEEFNSYNNAVNSSLFFLPKTKVIVQHEDRYVAQLEDPKIIRFGKWVKRSTRRMRWTGVRMVNAFRKKKQPLENLHQTLPMRDLGNYFFKHRLSRLLFHIHCETEHRLLDLIDEVQLLTSSMTFSAANPLAADAPPKEGDLEHLIDGFDRLIGHLKNDVKNAVAQVVKLMAIAEQKVGTFELNRSFFDPNTNAQRFQRVNASYRRFSRRITLNHRVIKENWILNHELDQFYDDLKISSKKTCTRLNDKIHKKLFKILEEIESSLNKSKEALSEKLNNREELMELVLRERSKVNGQFKKKLIPNSTRMMLFQNLPSVTLALQRDFENAKASVNTATSVKRDFSNKQKLRTTEISIINPREIIEYEYFDGLVKAEKGLRTELISINSRIQPSLLEISNIHAYTFESAVKSLESSEVPLKNVYEAIDQGFERTYGKLNEFREQMIAVAASATDELDLALDKLGKDLQHLKVVDSALETNLRILDRKARSRTKTYFDRIKNGLTRLYKECKRLVLQTFFKTVELYQTTEKTLTTDLRGVDDSVTTFLNHASKSIESLPFIYRLLFRQEPLDDYNFFVGRKQEINGLQNALSSWKEGNYASVLLSGPRGSGLTSLFNYFEAQVLDEELLVNRIVPKRNIAEREELLGLLKEVFNQEKFQNIDDIAHYLNDCGIHRIVLVDQLQRFFLRRIDGFEVLHDLQKLIRLTQKNVFWVATISKLSLNYLNKTIQLGEFFSWNIEMGSLDKAGVDLVIKKRHEVSGFNLQYDPRIAGSSKKFRKLPPEEQQQYLATTFLTQLHKISEGSLSLALMVWVLALEVLDKKTLMVHPVPSVRDVLRSVSMEKINILQALLLHDGLNFDELFEVVAMDSATLKSHLATMEKSRMIIHDHDLIKLNTLLYWSAISVLKNKNILH